MKVIVNTNDQVRVRLTELGHQVHKKFEHDLMHGHPYKYVPPVEDKDGWSKWHLWELMQL